MMIREATAEDWPAIWPFFHEIVAAGDTYTYSTELGEDESRELWMLAAPNRTVVAVDEAGTIRGSAKMNNNQGGPGSHIASASYMVDPSSWGGGVGRALCEYSLEWAREAGFHGMQFNAVAETNTRAVALYEALGFEILGTVPEGFLHPSQGYVGLHIMFRPLKRSA